MNLISGEDLDSTIPSTMAAEYTRLFQAHQQKMENCRSSLEASAHGRLELVKVADNVTKEAQKDMKGFKALCANYGYKITL